MRIAVLGTGAVGQAVAAKLAALGHEVAVGARDPDATLAWTEPDALGNPPFAVWREAHPEVGLATPPHAAARAELIVNASNGAGSIAFLESAGEQNLSGKALIDIANRSTSRTGCRRRCSSPIPTRSANRSSAASPKRGWSRRSTR